MHKGETTTEEYFVELNKYLNIKKWKKSMKNQFSRTELLIGKAGVEKLKDAKVAVYGIGGVGSYTVEGLARAGVGHLVLIDWDDVDITNINRQILALHSTVGKKKTEVMKERILDINPDAKVEIYEPKDIESGEEKLIDGSFSYVVDAIDTMTAKLKVIERAYKVGVNIISATGAGNKLDPTQFEITDIYKTSVCPVCKILRKELKNRGIKKHKVIYSKEEPAKLIEDEEQKNTLGSISFVPSVAGLIVAGEVIRDILEL